MRGGGGKREMKGIKREPPCMQSFGMSMNITVALGEQQARSSAQVMDSGGLRVLRSGGESPFTPPAAGLSDAVSDADAKLTRPELTSRSKDSSCCLSPYRSRKYLLRRDCLRWTTINQPINQSDFISIALFIQQR